MFGRRQRPNTQLPVRVHKAAANPQQDETSLKTEESPAPEPANPDPEQGEAATVSIAEPPPPAESPAQSPTPSGPPVTARNALLAVLGGIIALALAGFGEALVESGDKSVLSLVLYLAAIGIFAASAALLPRAPSDIASTDAPPDLPRKGDKTIWPVIVIGIVAAVALDLLSFLMLRDNLKSEGGKWLWLGSMAVILAMGIMLHKRHTWPARWSGNNWPRARSSRALVIAFIIVIGLAAVLARFSALDTVPLGINADEGDRAATAIQILRQTNTESVFGDGWYEISMMYFTLLAGLMKVIGIGFVQARVFGVIASLIACGVLIWIGARHWNWRVGLLAGGLFATLGIALQFARETSESGPTAALWAISMALFYEAARTGRLWAWAGAGLAGGFSFYFYPTGRLWAALAAIICIYLLIHGLKNRRLAIARGVVVAAVAAIIVITPFAVNILRDPNKFTIRAQETTIFSPTNPTRLRYYNPEWSLPRLMVEQTIRGVGGMNQFFDDGGFWPTDEPMFNGAIAVLIMLGIGFVCLKVRDPRFALLAAWFWVGIIGVIVTVETPNFQRMGTAIPTLALIPALLLDNLIRRVEVGASKIKIAWAKPAMVAATGVAALSVAGIALNQTTYYFNEYGKRDRYPQPTIQGQAVRDQGENTLTVTLSGSYHMINSGWIQLLAPFTPRGGMRFAGWDLPMTAPANTNLAFMIYPYQKYYLPYLQDLYPTGTLEPYTHPSEGTVVTILRVGQADWAAQQGATAQVEGSGTAVHVSGLGAAPPGITSYPANVTWKAGVRIPAYWNYNFRIGPGPAKLLIDGKEVMSVAPGTGSGIATVALAAGDHLVQYDGTIENENIPAQFAWAQSAASPNSTDIAWSPMPTEVQFANKTELHGLYGVARVEGHPEEHYLTNALAQCCLNELLRNDGKPYTVDWAGTLDAPATGSYTMTLMMHGTGFLKIDDREVIRRDQSSEESFSAGIELSAGKHTIELSMSSGNTRGDIELRWTPPGGIDSIVPTSALSPPEGAVGPEPPLDPAAFSGTRLLLQHNPLETIR